jgi:hypothetical protein
LSRKIIALVRNYRVAERIRFFFSAEKLRQGKSEIGCNAHSFCGDYLSVLVYYCIGDLQLMSEGYISISQLKDSDDQVDFGAKVVTSQVSDKYHPGLLIGYVQNLEMDSNNLTKSGTITPAVDFEHLRSVLVITDMKRQIDPEDVL